MLRTVQGYELKRHLSEARVVSEAEGKRIRAEDLIHDKKYGGWFIPGTNVKKLNVNPETYTEEERKFMES